MDGEKGAEKVGGGKTHSFGDTFTTEEDIHFFQRQSLRLGHEKPNECSASKRQQSKEDEGSKGNLLQHDGRDLADDEIRHPVRGCAKGNAVSAIG